MPGPSLTPRPGTGASTGRSTIPKPHALDRAGFESQPVETPVRGAVRRPVRRVRGGGNRWTTRDRAGNVRLYRLATEVLSAVEAGVFPPRVDWHCQDCPVRSRCWAWG
jgi:hypothetical protein